MVVILAVLTTLSITVSRYRDCLRRILWVAGKELDDRCSRAVIIRGAGWADLQTNALVLWGMALGVLWFSSRRFRNQGS